MSPMHIVPTLSFALSSLAVVALAPASAAVVKARTIGCGKLADAKTIASARDPRLAATLSHALKRSHACIEFSQGVVIEIEERQPPLACVRLTGDLSCYWIAAVYVEMNGEREAPPSAGLKVGPSGRTGGSGTGINTDRSRGFSIGN